MHPFPDFQWWHWHNTCHQGQRDYRQQTQVQIIKDQSMEDQAAQRHTPTLLRHTLGRSDPWLHDIMVPGSSRCNGKDHWWSGFGCEEPKDKGSNSGEFWAVEWLHCSLFPLVNQIMLSGSIWCVLDSFFWSYTYWIYCLTSELIWLTVCLKLAWFYLVCILSCAIDR